MAALVSKSPLLCSLMFGGSESKISLASCSQVLAGCFPGEDGKRGTPFLPFQLPEGSVLLGLAAASSVLITLASATLAPGCP